MTDATKGAVLLGSVLAVGIMAGLGIGWSLWKPTPTKAETYAKAQRQCDGSLILERKPQADAKPAQEIPKGAKVERVVQVVVQPRASAAATVQTSGPAPEDAAPVPTARQFIAEIPCPPVRVDLSLVRMPDQTRRVIASSPDGEVVGGVDIPVETAAPVRTLKWGAGFEYAVNSWGNTKSLLVQRDIGFLRFGARAGRIVMTMPTGGTVQGGEAAISAVIRF